AIHAPDLELQKDAIRTARQIAYLANASVIPTRLLATAHPAARFFERLTSFTTRGCGSPNTPLTSSCGQNPGNR
ncbi:MAG: hypothetical protein ABIO49_10080, partial [Dokdonella sp.]